MNKNKKLGKFNPFTGNPIRSKKKKLKRRPPPPPPSPRRPFRHPPRPRKRRPPPPPRCVYCDCYPCECIDYDYEFPCNYPCDDGGWFGDYGPLGYPPRWRNPTYCYGPTPPCLPFGGGCPPVDFFPIYSPPMCPEFRY
jgi:hypothetical protein